MTVAIIADIHDNLACLDKCLIWCRQNKVSNIICCGDLGNLDTILFLAQNFSGEIFVVTGNADTFEEKDLAKLKNVHYCGEISISEIAGLNIGFCHEPQDVKKIKELAPFDLDFIFCGHTHRPDLKKDGNTIIANPGTLAGIFTPATFAILNTENKNLELKLLADLKIKK